MKGKEFKLNNGSEVQNYAEFKEYVKETLANIKKAMDENENLPPSYLGENVTDITKSVAYMGTKLLKMDPIFKKALNMIVPIKKSSKGPEHDKLDAVSLLNAIENGKLEKVIDLIEDMYLAKGDEKGLNDLTTETKKAYISYLENHDKGLTADEALNKTPLKTYARENNLPEINKTLKKGGEIYYFNYNKKGTIESIQDTIKSGDKHSVRAYKTALDKYNNAFKDNHQFKRLSIVLEKVDDPFIALDVLQQSKGYTAPRRYAEEIFDYVENEFSFEESKDVNIALTAHLLHEVKAMHDRRGFFSKMFNMIKNHKESVLIEKLENSLKSKGCDKEFIKRVESKNYDVREEYSENFVSEYELLNGKDERIPFDFSKEVEEKVDAILENGNKDFIKENQKEEIAEIKEENEDIAEM